MRSIRDGYILELDDYDKECAETELGEDPEQTASRLEILRTGLREADYINSREDDDFLLMFVRQAKFSQTRARQVIDNFIRNRLTDPYQKVYTNAPTLDPKVISITRDYELSFVLPKVAGSGQRIVIQRPGKFNKKAFSMVDVMRAAMVNFEVALLDPMTQVHGIHTIMDYSNVKLSFFTEYTPTNLQISAAAFHDAVPARSKGMHLYKAPRIIAAAVKIYKKFLRKESADRIHVHSDIKSLLGAFDASVLPDELGGTAGTYKELSDRWFEHVQQHTEVFGKYRDITFDASRAPSKAETD